MSTEGRCYYCGVVVVRPVTGNVSPRGRTRDHVTPVSRDPTTPRYTVRACAWCNGLKSDRTREEFRKFLIEVAPADWNGLFADDQPRRRWLPGDLLWFGAKGDSWHDCHRSFQALCPRAAR